MESRENSTITTPTAGDPAAAALREALGDGCCPRHVALGSSMGAARKVTPLDGPCGPLTMADLGTMTAVAEEGLAGSDPGLYARGALRAALVLCATLATHLEAT